MWIHEHKDWPNFVWDAGRLASVLADARYRQGRLIGRMESLSFDLRREASLVMLTNDVVKSSAIEGENLDPEEVRSSVAGRLGIEAEGISRAGREVEGIVEITLDAARRFAEPLTKERLFGWHAALFPGGCSGLRRIAAARWRPAEAGKMQVVSGACGRTKVHFEAPEADRLDREMETFLEWFESEDGTGPVLRAGIAHLWFVTVHPFQDGNGRIARAVADMSLARAEGSADRFYSLSTQTSFERGDYYAHLEKQQRGTPDITSWLEWFLGCLCRAVGGAEDILDRVLFKARLWDRINRQPANGRQRLIINRMLEEGFTGHMNTSKYARIAKCSSDTALRDIRELATRGVFVRNPGGGRSTSYRIVDDIS